MKNHSNFFSQHDVVVRIGAGENWHETVLWAHENGYYGLENLALIPGSVGASPIQNIGAYGAELSDVIERIEVVHSGSLTTRSLLPSDCQFAYRDSIFKTEKGRDWLITAVDMKLSKTPTLVVWMRMLYSGQSAFLGRLEISKRVAL